MRHSKIYTLTTMAECCRQFCIPLLAILFFSTDSPLRQNNGSHMGHWALYYGLTLAMVRTGSVLANIIMTPFSDSWGRRFTWMTSFLGLGFVAITGLSSLLTHHFFPLMIGCLFGFSIELSRSTAMACIGDLKQQSQDTAYNRPLTSKATHSVFNKLFLTIQSLNKNKLNAMAFLQGFIAIGAAIAPLINASLLSIPYLPLYSAPFILMLVLSVAGFIISSRITRIPQSKEVKKPKIILSFKTNSIIFLKNADYRLLMIILLLSQWLWGSYYQFMPAELKSFSHLSSPSIQEFVSTLCTSIIIGSFIIIPLCERILTTMQMLSLAITFEGAGIILSLIWMHHIPLKSHAFIYLIGTLVPIGNIIIYAILVTLLSSATDKKHRAQILGFSTVCASLMMVLSSLINGVLMSFSTLLPLTVLPINLVVLAIFLYTKKNNKLFA